MALEHDVQAMMDAGVPEEAIGQYIREQSKTAYKEATEDKGIVESFIEGAKDPRTAWQGTGGAIGTVIGGGAALLDPIPGDEPLGVLAGGALGSSIGGQAYDLYKGLSDWFEGKPATQTVGGQILRAAEDVAMDLAVPAVAGKTLELAGRAGRAALSPIKTSLKGRVGQVGAEGVEAISRMEEAGFRPEIGMLDNPEAQQLSQSLRNMPASGKIMAQVDRANLERGAQLADETARQFGTPLDFVEAGSVIRREADAAQDRFFKSAESYFSKVAEFVPDNVPANNVNTVIQDIIGKSENPLAQRYLAESIDLAKRAASAVDEDGMIAKESLDTIKKLSRDAYKKNPALRTDSDRFIIQLERAADRDITEAALATGGKDAAKAVKTAKDWWKMGKGDMRVGDVGLLDDTAFILKQSEDGRIYSWLKGQGKDGANRLKRVLNMMDDQAAGDVKATVFHELGMPPAGQRSAFGDDFSFNSFLTNYNKLSDPAKDALFGKASKEMNQLLEASQYMKSLEKRANFSNTDNMRVWRELLNPISSGIRQGGALGGLTGAAKGATFGVAGQVAQLAVNNRAAKLISDPKFVKWLATTGKKVLVKPTDVAPQVARLAAIASRNPDEAEDYKAYINALGYDTKMIKKNGKTTLEVQ